MNDEKRRLRDEIADLSEAVRDLREQLAQRDAHQCACTHRHLRATPVYPVYPSCPQLPYYYSSPSGTACGSTTAGGGSSTTTLAGTVSYS